MCSWFSKPFDKFASREPWVRGESIIKYTQKVIQEITHKCKKVESKPFQSLSNHHGVKFVEFIVCCIKSLKNFSVLKVGQI
jgi:hypothetical protein